jgi:glucokinase
MPPLRLIADIGGTWARFALSPGESALDRQIDLAVADHPDFESALAEYLDRSGARPDALAIAVAGPVAGNRADLTNAAWSIEAAAIGRRFGIAGVCLVNDFEAVAHALPLLGRDDCEAIGNGVAVAGAPMVALGPGTGLGVAALVPVRTGAVAIAGEGGHVTLPARTGAEAEIIAALRTRFGHVSAERALSGQGLRDLYRALAGTLEEPPPAAEIAARAEAGDAVAHSTLVHFAGFLGSVAADMALAFGARGGVYLAGGVLHRLGPVFDRGLFRARFADKGRFSGYMAGIPTWLIRREDAGLLGLTSAHLDL